MTDATARGDGRSIFLGMANAALNNNFLDEKSGSSSQSRGGGNNRIRGYVDATRVVRGKRNLGNKLGGTWFAASVLFKFLSVLESTKCAKSKIVAGITEVDSEFDIDCYIVEDDDGDGFQTDFHGRSPGFWSSKGGISVYGGRDSCVGPFV